MSEKKTTVHDVAVGLLVLVVGAMVMKYADLPTRVSVVEANAVSMKEAQDDIKKTVHAILERMP